MKIVLVSIYRDGSETGVAKVSERLAKELSKRNQVLYLCLGEDYGLTKKTKTLSLLTVPSIPIKQGFIPKLSNEVTEAIYSELDRFKPDVIHAQNIVFTALISLVWAVQNSVPFVLTLHSQPTQGIKYFLPKGAKKTVLNSIDYSPTDPYVRKFLEKTDCIISLNSSITDSVETLTENANLIHLQNGIPLAECYKVPTTRISNTVHCLYIGMYMPRKNQEFLVRAFSHLPTNYHLTIHGNQETGKDYLNKLKTLLKEHDITNVTLGGFIEFSEVTKQLERSHYVVSASLKEVQSLSILESLATGTPVFGLENETLVEVIDGKNGKVLSQKTTPEKFAREFEKYVSANKKTYTALTKHARESVKKYDLQYVSVELESIYKTLIKEKKNHKKSVSNWEILIPDQLKEFFGQDADTPTRRPSWIRFYASATIILSTIVWPIAQFFRLLQRVKKG